jgi:hypothetical protein
MSEEVGSCGEGGAELSESRGRHGVEGVMRRGAEDCEGDGGQVQS